MTAERQINMNIIQVVLFIGLTTVVVFDQVGKVIFVGVNSLQQSSTSFFGKTSTIQFVHVPKYHTNYRSTSSESTTSSNNGSNKSLLSMRDGSASYWFQIGDHVRVCDDVIKGGNNLIGYKGIVIETWEKCTVDPTCCCAEQVDDNMAVLVQFTTTTTKTTTTPSSSSSSTFSAFNNDKKLQQQQDVELMTSATATADGVASSTFSHYFAEAELVKIPTVIPVMNK